MTRIISLCRIKSSDNNRTAAGWALFSDIADAYPVSNVWKPPATPRPSPYEIRKVDGKGFGMIATRAIKRGEVIVRERPILMTPQMITSYEDMEKYLLQLLYWLEQDDREKLVRLHNCKSFGECGPLTGILRTNALGAIFSSSQICSQYPAVCLDISRANHSCSQNAFYLFDKEPVVFSLHAYHDIYPGEEITINYLGEGMTRPERQAELKQKYLFTCTCKMCSASAVLIAESDKARKTIRSHLGSVLSFFDHWMYLSASAQERKATLETVVAGVDSFLTLMEEEDIHDGRIDVLQIPVYMYGAVCDLYNFKIWVGRNLLYLQSREEVTGTKFKVREVCEGWLRDPTSFPLWD